MKRATVMILILSLCSLPLFAGDHATKLRCVSLEHVSGGWMMKVECVEGAGTISLSDDGSYRGAGMFSKWSQQQLSATYQSLVPTDEARIELQQLG